MEKLKKTERINSNKAMIDVSPKKIGEEIKVDSRRIRSIFNSDKFKKNFGAESIEKNYKNPSIKYKVQAEIEDLMKLVLKSYKDFEKIDKDRDAISFINYSNKIIEGVDGLDEYKRRYIKAHPSYKYNQIMSRYYEEFIERIVVLISMFVNTDFRNKDIENDEAFRKTIFSLDEIIRQLSLDRLIGRTKAGFNKYSINNAIKDTVKFSERDTSELYTKVLTDIVKAPDNKYQIMGNGIPNHIVPGLKEEYLKMTNEEKCKEMTRTAKYKELYVNKEEIDLDWDKYFDDYSYYFIQYSVNNISRYDELHKLTYQYTDLYGRMLRHNICEGIDKEVEIIDEFANGNKEVDILVKHIFYEEDFLKYKNERIVLNYSSDVKIEEKDIFKYYSASADVRKKAATVISFIEKCREDKLEEVDFGDRVILTEFFKYCIGIIAGLDFKSEVQKIERRFKEDKNTVKGNKNYKAMLNAINKCVGEIWKNF